MPREFQRGHKAKVGDLTAGTDLYVGVQISAPGLAFDISCFGLDADERLSDDRYFVFFNQPKSPEESIQLLGEQAGDTESFRVTLDRVPPQIQKLSFTATIDGDGRMSQIAPGYLRIVAGGEEVARYAFDGSEFSTERAVMLGDFYLKDVWRFAAVGQGFDGGLDALLKNFGGEVAEEEPAQAPEPPAEAPAFAPPAFAPPAAPTTAAVPPQAPAPAAPAPAPSFGTPVPAAPPAPAPAPSFGAPAPTTPPPAPAPAFAPHAAPTIAAGLHTPPASTIPPPPTPTAPAPQGGPFTPPGTTPPGAPFGTPGTTPPAAPFGQPGTTPPGAPFGTTPPPGAPFGAPTSLAPVPPEAGLRAVLTKYAEAPVGDRWTEQNPELVRATLTKGANILAKQGSMVAYQGDIDFAHKGSGLLGKLTGQLTGQGMSLMRCSGDGEVFLADEASRLFVIRLQGEQLYTSARGVLAFDEALDTEVRRIEGVGLPGGGLFSMLFSGTGAVVVKTRGVPVVLPVGPATYVDGNAVIAWSAGAQAVTTTSLRLRRSGYARQSAEAVNLQFRGAPGNFVVVQPFEV
ncbi:TerD family protein [Streptomyces acidiscabies]|uniref:TerD family protein n=5 Tax=Streptomyces acidiscabies TaxID=42234 RepID=A0AAP6B9R1_9ACTN|nr:TerD family protein [Streptomyces acidiscabies]MBP5937059.1 stress protein [Streptomyces sp. LBUM 1476]MBZ3914897.1 TerD family protein [Streptomyces acidiscabies]MDX2960653.1 TerD family protein [Streptomyces acidiscabies]MDX3020813.1 TerD family protein [Streptomyces acidiscabies]